MRKEPPMIKMTQEEFDESLNHSFKLGIADGLERASLLLHDQATKQFGNEKDKEAYLLRSWAKTLKTESEEMHPGPYREKKKKGAADE